MSRNSLRYKVPLILIILPFRFIITCMYIYGCVHNGVDLTVWCIIWSGTRWFYTSLGVGGGLYLAGTEQIGAVVTPQREKSRVPTGP